MISLIVAVSKNNAIGKDNKLLFHIKEDLAFFKKTTLNKTIVMGRKTFESLPGILPSRKHIVITRDKDYKIDNPNVEVRHSLIEVLNEYKHSSKELFVIGGGEIYKQSIESGLLDRMYITKVDKIVEGADTFFPEISSEYYELANFKILSKEATVYIYRKI